MTWQPIETAPKDGTKILVYQPFGRWHSAWMATADEFPVGDVAFSMELRGGGIRKLERLFKTCKCQELEAVRVPSGAPTP